MSGPTSELTSEIVRAGAGAGKTYYLVHKVLELGRNFEKQHGRKPRIVVTTFTRKATEELRERLIREAAEQQSLDMLEYVSSRSLVWISTIHGVLNLMLKKLGPLLDVDSGFKLVDEAQIENMARKVLRDILVQKPEALELLEIFPMHRLTRMLLAFYEAQSENPALQPHNKDSLTQCLLETIHWEADMLLPVLNEMEPVVLDRGEKWQEYIFIWAKLLESAQKVKTLEEALALQAVETPRQPSLKKDEKPEEVEHWAKAHKSFKEFIKNLKAEDFTEFERVFSLFSDVGREFSQRLMSRKKAVSLFSMSDLETLSLNSMRERPEELEHFAGEWDYWLIDEFQDTSPVQVELLKTLMKNQPRFLVGDPQQSIYLFRGARSEIFAASEAEFAEKGWQQKLLPKNYRSRSELLLFFNQFFTKVSKQFRAMEPKDDSNSDDAVAWQYQVADEEGEHKAIASQVEYLLKDKSCSLSDISILGRTNQQLQDWAEVLRQFGYPTQVHASSGFYQRREILDVSSFLQFLVNPHDNVNLIQLLRSPWFFIEDGELASFLPKATESFWLNLKTKNHPSILRLHEYLKLTDSEGYLFSTQKFLKDSGVIDFSHYHDSSGRRESNVWKWFELFWEESRKPGFQVVSFLKSGLQFADSEGDSEESDAVACLEPNRINLMTVHASKGLEFKHVILPGCSKAPRPPKAKLLTVEDGYFSFDLPVEGEMTSTPAVDIWRLRRKQKERQENERLLYVAMTRAIETVTLIGTYDSKDGSWSQKIPHLPNLKRIEEFPEPSKYMADKSTATQVRAPYSSPLDLRTDTVSVTDLIQQNETKTADIESLQKAAQGVLLHKVLEAIRQKPDLDREQLVRLWFQDPIEPILHALDWIEKLKYPPMKELLSTGHSEWGFQLKIESDILQGQIDLWGETADAIWLIDYKSGKSRYMEKAFEQLQIYKKVLDKLNLGKPIKMVALYPFEQKAEIR